MLELTHETRVQLRESSAWENTWLLALAAVRERAQTRKAEQDSERKRKKSAFFDRWRT